MPTYLILRARFVYRNLIVALSGSHIIQAQPDDALRILAQRLPGSARIPQCERVLTWHYLRGCKLHLFWHLNEARTETRRVGFNIRIYIPQGTRHKARLTSEDTLLVHNNEEHRSPFPRGSDTPLVKRILKALTRPLVAYVVNSYICISCINLAILSKSQRS
ncbi:hypothetical protein HDV57DRAFT_20050 [Trichoderma longibrachiatum]